VLARLKGQAMTRTLSSALRKAHDAALDILDTFQQLIALRRDGARWKALEGALRAAGKPFGLWEILQRPEPKGLLADVPGGEPAIAIAEATLPRFRKAALRFSKAVAQTGRCSRAAMDSLASARRTWWPTFQLHLPMFPVTELSAHAALFQWADLVQWLLTECCPGFPSSIPARALPLCYRILEEVEPAVPDIDALQIQLEAEYGDALRQASGTDGKPRAPRKCRARDLDPEISAYLQNHQIAFRRLVPRCRAGDRAALKEFHERFGLNAITEALEKKRIDCGCGRQNVERTRTYLNMVKPLLEKPPRAPDWWKTAQDIASEPDDTIAGMLDQVGGARR